MSRCLWLCVQGTQAEAAIKKYGDKEIHWSMQGMLRLMPAAIMRLFQPTLDNIKNAISQVLSSPDVAGELTPPLIVCLHFNPLTPTVAVWVQL